MSKKYGKKKEKMGKDDKHVGKPIRKKLKIRRGPCQI